MPMARMLMATPDTIWSTANVTVATACRSPPSAPKATADDEPGPRSPLVARPAGTERAEDEHPLEADVDHAGPLRPQAAESGHADGHGQAERGGHRARGREVLDSGDHPDHGEDQQQDGGQVQGTHPVSLRLDCRRRLGSIIASDGE